MKLIFPLRAFNCFCFNQKGTKRIDFYGQSISHKLENAKGEKNIKCTTICISLHYKPLKCFKFIKIEVSKKTRTSLSSRMVLHTDDGRVMTISQILYGQFGIYFGYICVQGQQLSSKCPFVCLQIDQKNLRNICKDFCPSLNLNTQKLISSICQPKPKSLGYH